ncbi:hypothetical protein GBA52_003692 [Prunus armeniaca]|nr:hypothetical protein GBA52_003692 [Prunus armeniaca]
MGKMEHTLSKLLNMCVTAEKTFKREGGNGTIVVFYKGSTSSTKPSNKDHLKDVVSIKELMDACCETSRMIGCKPKPDYRTK